jgi:hypothetical protein
MISREIWVAIALSLVVEAFCDVSLWVARKLVRWSARRRYTDPSRAEIRAEELAALIDELPGKPLKLITALGFAAVAIIVSVSRKLSIQKIAHKVWHSTNWAAALTAGLGFGLAGGLLIGPATRFVFDLGVALSAARSAVWLGAVLIMALVLGWAIHLGASGVLC